MTMRPQNRIGIAAAIAFGVLVGIVAFRQIAERRGEELELELELSIARMPLGITGAEADAIVGGSPDHVSHAVSSVSWLSRGSGTSISRPIRRCRPVFDVPFESLRPDHNALRRQFAQLLPGHIWIG